MDLNDRQKAYLLALYQLDQEAERNNKIARLKWGEGKPASVWRWIEYGPKDLPEALSWNPPLRHNLMKKNLVDQGAGSTWGALADRKLILRKWEHIQVGPHRGEVLFVQLTRAGRKQARELSGDSAKAKKKGKLSIGAWRVLAFAYQSPGKIWTYDVWHKSNLLPPNPLIVSGIGKKLIRLGLAVGHWDSLAITEAGIEFYEKNYSYYHQLYPKVNAPEPGTEREG